MLSSIKSLKRSQWKDPGGEGCSLEFLAGVCRPHFQIQTLFQTKKCHFPHPFSDLASKIHTRFQTWPCTWLSIAYASGLKWIQRNKDEQVKFSWNDLFYLFLFHSPPWMEVDFTTIRIRHSSPLFSMTQCLHTSFHDPGDRVLMQVFSLVVMVGIKDL